MNKKQLIFLFIFLLLIYRIVLAQEVTGIFCDEKEPYAIVNGDVVKVGDTVNGGKVIEIKPNFVKFQYGNSIYEKKLTDKTLEVKKAEINPVQEPIKNKKQSIKTTEDGEHYKKAKEYKSKADYRYTQSGFFYDNGELKLSADSDSGKMLELYKQALKEGELAIFETSGESRDEINKLIYDCKEKTRKTEEGIQYYERRRKSSSMEGSQLPKEKSPRELTNEMKRNGWKGIGSTQNKAISDSKKEIENKRSEYGK